MRCKTTGDRSVRETFFSRQAKTAGDFDQNGFLKKKNDQTIKRSNDQTIKRSNDQKF
jgi:hypothetical protein